MVEMTPEERKAWALKELAKLFREGRITVLTRGVGQNGSS